MNCRRSLVVAIAVVTGAASVAVPAGTSNAQDDRERVEEDVAEADEALEHATARAREAAAAYQDAADALPGAEARLREAREQVETAGARKESAAEEERAAEADLDRATRSHRRLLAEVERAQDRVNKIAVAAYKGSDIYTLNAMMSAHGPGDVINRLGLIDRIAANEHEAMDELADARVRAGDALQEATLAEQRAEQARVAAQDALAAARTANREAAEAAEEVAALVAARAEALAVAEEEVEKAEAEKARVEAELREWEEANRDAAPVLEPGMTLLMPVDGEKTSDYGMRHDPITGEERLHAGTDFAAAGGAPIWAAADATVMQAGWNGGYGNFTCLSHGTYEDQGLSTCYAHQSEILIEAGEAVQAGDVIGRVGSTGNSTGDHLHFEARLDGTATDPLPWLPDCLC